MFRTEAELLAHMQEMHVQCSGCGAWFFNEGARDLHYDVAHPTCSFCGRVFKVFGKYMYKLA